MLGLKIVTELKLSFDGFENEAGDKLNFDIALVHARPFNLRVEEINEIEEEEEEERRTKWLPRRASQLAIRRASLCDETFAGLSFVSSLPVLDTGH